MPTWGYSSVGQSTCLASRGSSVRIRLSPPQFIGTQLMAEQTPCLAERNSISRMPRAVRRSIRWVLTDGFLEKTILYIGTQLRWLEHHPDKVGVGGSSPLVPTIKTPRIKSVVFLWCGLVNTNAPRLLAGGIMRSICPCTEGCRSVSA